MCADIKSATTIEARKVIIAQYASYVDGMDDPEKLMGKQVTNNALDKEICAMSMALRSLTYGELTRVPNVKPEEKAVFGSVSMATTNLVNYFSKQLWQGGHVITHKNLNWPVKSRITNSIAFFPICKAGKYLFLDLMTRSKLASTCGPEYFKGIDISEVISKAVGEKKYPVTKDTTECSGVVDTIATSETWGGKTIACEQSILQNTLYNSRSLNNVKYVLIIAAMNTPGVSTSAVEVPFKNVTERKDIKFVTPNEYWKNRPNAPTGLDNRFANINYRLPWFQDIVTKVRTISTDASLDFPSAIVDSEQMASLYLRHGNKTPCETQIAPIAFYPTRSESRASSSGNSNSYVDKNK